MQTMRAWARLFLFALLFSLTLSPVHGNVPETPVTETPFPVLDGLEESVEFWKQVFTVYDASQLIFFDPLEPTKIYTVVEVKDERNLRRLINAVKRKIAATHGVGRDRIRAQRGIKDRFLDGLARSGQFIEQMQQIFQEMELPVELVYLPLIESSFNVHAHSRAGAVGLWQFTRSTGRRFLRVGGFIDERKDPLESTRAAAKLLKENYEVLGNWPLAVTAYNHGQEGLSRAIARVGSRDLMEIIRDYDGRLWGFASKNFYAEFLAALEVAKNVELYFPDIEFHAPLTIREMELQKATPLTTLIQSAGVSRTEFLEWNPALSSKIQIVPQGYRIKIPTDKLKTLAEARDGLPVSGWVRHRVRRGETLSHIARRYDASIEEIQEINGLQRIHLINTGQILLIPKP